LFKLPKYTTASERVFCAATLIIVIGGIVKWWFF
jgi:hypothetical protein